MPNSFWGIPLIYKFYIYKVYLLAEGGGVLSYMRLLGMCRWMGLQFHDWSDYNGVAFSIELLELGHKFSDFLGK